jgi:NADPH:quinone reductase-like Zn-dependent oxidoreductase
MKAIRYCEYGSADVLKFEDVEKPVPNNVMFEQAGSVAWAGFTALQGLNETGDALRYLETGHARGKVVITVE